MIELKNVEKVYNRQANEDKNEIAVRTEQFINQRLEKINTEWTAECRIPDSAGSSFQTPSPHPPALRGRNR